MKKAEAISILATSVRPREAKDRARYDEAVRMAIEALKCSETPKSSERTSETAQPEKQLATDTISRRAAIDAICNACGKIDCDKMDKCEKLQLPPANCSEFPNNSDTISRQAAIDAITDELMPSTPLSAVIRAKNRLKELPAVQPDHTADSGKKVCVDTISRQAAIEALARMMPRSYTPDGSHPADEEIFRAQEVFADCIEALEILPSAQPERDIPIKPNETTDTAWGIPHRQAVCPKCDYYLGHVVFIGDGKSKKVTYCETCGQAIDWEGWDFDE